jgi:hypothetical protein
MHARQLFDGGRPMPGFDEERATFTPLEPRDLIGQFRNLGDCGPAYEIMDVDAAGNVVIEIIYSGERVAEKLANVLQDPLATVIP